MKRTTAATGVALLTALLLSCADPPAFTENDLDGFAGCAVLLDGKSGTVVSLLRPEIAAERPFIAGDALRLATLLVAIEKRLVDPDGGFTCRDDGRETPVGLADALAAPCASVFTEMERKIPWEEMRRYLLLFGFGAPTRLGGPLENAGELPDHLIGERGWNLWDDTSIRITPLQGAVFFRRLVRGDLPLRRETIDEALRLLGRGGATGGRRGTKGARLSGSYRGEHFSFAWAEAEFRSGRRELVAHVFLLGKGDGPDGKRAGQILDNWWEREKRKGKN